MAVEQCDYRGINNVRNGFWQHFGNLLQLMGQKIARWDQLSQQRQLLQEMDDHLLKDIGLSRADIMRITNRPFWDDPVEKGIKLDDRYRKGG